MDNFSGVVILLHLVCFSCFLNDVTGEVVHIIILTVKYTDVNTDSTHRPQYQCYRSNVDSSASLSFGRSAPITSDLSPPSDQGHSTDQSIRVVFFPRYQQWDSNGFGPFYCQASKPDQDITRVTTFFQRSDAKFRPSDGMFTKTVNVNDTNVMISMDEQTFPTNEIRWRKDGGPILNMYNGHSQISLPSPIQTTVGGIYEIHYNTERNSNRGGLYRIIVRECPAGKWGPPGCYGICDKCYNGGVCDDMSGLCICPNNFKGPNCLEICRSYGGNRFGLNCEFRCTYRSDNPIACHGNLFCLPDPYGCSCDVGVHGYACNTECNPGTYGPSCSQTCHCASSSSCNIYTGQCTSLGCETGWSGDNCQIPDVCEAGYYGSNCIDKCHCLNDAACNRITGECPQQQCAPGYIVHSGQVDCQECESGLFGLGCLQQCHCRPEACDKVTGTCNGQCIDNWLEPECQTRITGLESVKVNPYQPSNFTCYVEGNPPPSETSLNLYRVDGSRTNNTGITKSSSSITGSVVFQVDNVYPDDDYVCVLTVGGSSTSTFITSSTYVLPVISETPVILSTTSTTVHIQWNAWSEEDDIGDPPLVGYDVLVRKGSEWTPDQRVDEPTTSAIVENLNPDTEYRFRVAAVREGLGGTGDPSPRTEITTLCGKPSDTPSVLEISAVYPKELQVHWESLSPSSAACRSGVISYMIYYNPTGSSTPISVNVSHDVRSYNLTGLDIYLDYTVWITASNKDEESDRSTDIVERTLEEVAPAPIDVNIPVSTTSSFTVSWSTPLPSNINGNIQKYNIRYQQTAPVSLDDYEIVEVTIDAYEGEYTVEDLTAESNYSVQVQTVNGAGSSNWSSPVLVKTVNSGGTSSISIGPVIGGVMAVIIILVVILVLVILMRRRNEKGDDSKPIRNNSGNAVIYENEEIGYRDDDDGVAYEKPVVEESAYEGVDVQPPPPAVLPTKPAIQPRVQLKNTNGKPVAVVAPERVNDKPKPPPQPKPYAVYAKEKSESSSKKKEHEDKSDTPPVAPRGQSLSRDKLAVSAGLKEKGQPGSQNKLEESSAEDVDSGAIYQNVTLPGVVLASELEEYIKSKKKGNTNELIHEFYLLNINQLHPWEVASKEKNKAKNRFKNIIAYDHSRVVLEKVDGDPHSDYYNANYINDYKEERAFIASQAPNTASLTAFWRMVWQENVSTIVMVTNLIEAGKDRCRQYWPKNPRSVEVMGEFSLFLLETEQFSDHVVRTLVVKKAGDEGDDRDDEKRTIKQFHYLSWPDMGVPEYSTTLITFTENVKEHHTKLKSNGRTGPMLVHCSAGVGRTGTFICLYNMLDMMRKEGKVNIYGFITKMRENRIKMVQTKEQYVFLYNSLLEVYLSGNTAIPVSKFQEKLDTLNRANSATKKANIQVEFENLHTLTPTPAANSFKGGRSSSNRKKNRYPDILPMERSRPYLASPGLADSTDYINASFLNTFQTKDVFLATQSPLPNTVVDIWRLVFDWKCPVIVMLNQLDEETCVQYWPEEGSMLLGSLEVTALDSESTMNFVKRRFSVTSDSGESVTVEQFEMLGWGVSHNKPDSPLSLLQLIEAVESSVKTAESKGPTVVHCINGIGRSGVFCALWSVMEKVRRDNTVDIFQAVKRLRCNRPNMVETLDQYQLCYDVLNHHLQQFEEYANLDIL